MNLTLFLFLSFSDWRFAISNKVFEWINPSDSRDIWNCECQIIIDGLTPNKTYVLYITRISICGCHRTHSTHTNEATAMGNVKVDYDFQVEKMKKEMNYNVSSHIRTSYIHRHSVSSLKDSSVWLKIAVTRMFILLN